MLWQEPEDTINREQEQVYEEFQDISDSLYVGDNGELPHDARRVLIKLLAGPALEAQQHSKLWPVLLREEQRIRSRLSELFLELMLDRELGVAFTRQADTGDLDTPTLLRRETLTFITSALILHIRMLLAQSEARGERAATSADELKEHLSLYEQSTNTDHAGFLNRVNSAINKAKEYNILQKIRGSEDRYEISPTLKLLFTPEEIQSLTLCYREILSGKVNKEGLVSEIEGAGV